LCSLLLYAARLCLFVLLHPPFPLTPTHLPRVRYHSSYLLVLPLLQHLLLLLLRPGMCALCCCCLVVVVSVCCLVACACLVFVVVVLLLSAATPHDCCWFARFRSLPLLLAQPTYRFARSHLCHSPADHYMPKERASHSLPISFDSLHSLAQTLLTTPTVSPLSLESLLRLSAPRLSAFYFLTIGVPYHWWIVAIRITELVLAESFSPFSQSQSQSQSLSSTPSYS
jgi:hypothetical protein